MELVAAKDEKKSAKLKHFDENIYRIIFTLSEQQETEVIDLLNKLMECDSKNLLKNKYIALEIKDKFRSLSAEWLGIELSRNELCKESIDTCSKKLKKIHPKEPVI